MFKFLSQHANICAACGGPLGEESLEAYGGRFHSSLCLRKSERDLKQSRKTKKSAGGGPGGCHCY